MLDSGKDIDSFIAGFDALASTLDKIGGNTARELQTTVKPLLHIKCFISFFIDVTSLRLCEREINIVSLHNVKVPMNTPINEIYMAQIQAKITPQSKRRY